MNEANSSNAKPSVTGNPYVGPQFFTQEQQDIFTGREREVNDLESLLAARRLVLFYAESGAGKTSLINAGLIPLMKEKHHFEVLPVTRVASSNIIGKKDVNVFVYSLISGINAKGIRGEQIAELRLKDFLLDVAYDNGDCTYVPFEEGDESEQDEEEEDDAISAEIRPRALIIDQLEELFTQYGGLSVHEARVDFFRQIAEAMDDDPYLYVLLSMRADYEYQLRPYEHLLPYGLRTRYYMPRMRPESALRAVEKPARLAGRPFEPGVAKELVDRLQRQQRFTSDDEKMTWEKGLTVEPVQLQVVCNQLWESLSETDGDTITMADLEMVARKMIGGGGDSAEVLSKFVNSALSNYYEQALHEALKVAPDAVSEDNLREWFSNQVITQMGTKGFLLRNEEETAGMPEAVVNVLDKHHILRTETRGTNQFVELVHDSFIQPVLTANQKWTRRQMLEKPWIAAAYRWDKRNRPNNELLEGELLENALQEAGDLKSQPVFVQDFLNESSHVESARKIEAEQARANKFEAINNELKQQKGQLEKQESRLKKQRLGLFCLALIVFTALLIAGWQFLEAQQKSRELLVAGLLQEAQRTMNQNHEAAILFSLMARSASAENQFTQQTDSLLLTGLSYINENDTGAESFYAEMDLPPVEGELRLLDKNDNFGSILLMNGDQLLQWHLESEEFEPITTIDAALIHAVSSDNSLALVQNEAPKHSIELKNLETGNSISLENEAPNLTLQAAQFNEDNSQIATAWCNSITQPDDPSSGNLNQDSTITADTNSDSSTCEIKIEHVDINEEDGEADTHSLKNIRGTIVDIVFIDTDTVLWAGKNGELLSWNFSVDDHSNFIEWNRSDSFQISSVLAVPEMELLFTVGKDGEDDESTFIQWWSFQNGEVEQMGNPFNLDYSVSEIALVPDESRLVALDNENNLHTWDINSENWMDYACNGIGRNPTYSEWHNLLDRLYIDQSETYSKVLNYEVCSQFELDISFALEAIRECDTSLAYERYDELSEASQEKFYEQALHTTFDSLISQFSNQTNFDDDIFDQCVNQAIDLMAGTPETLPSNEEFRDIIIGISEWHHIDAAPTVLEATALFDKISELPDYVSVNLMNRLGSKLGQLCFTNNTGLSSDLDVCQKWAELSIEPSAPPILTNQLSIWPLKAEKGSDLVISMEATDYSLDPILHLYGSDGTLLSSNDDFDGLNAQITVRVPETGTYFIETDAYSGAGEYTLTIDRITLASLNPNESISSTIGEQSTVLFQGEEGEIIEFTLSENSDYYIDGLIVTDEGGNFLDEGETSVTFIVPDDSPYFLQIYGEDSAEYTITSSLIHSQEFEVGESVSASLADTPLLRFEGEEGSIVQLDLIGDTNLDIYDIILLDEFGSYLDSGWTSVETLLPSDGVYFIQIEGEDSAEYTITSSLIQSQEFEVGEPVSASLADTPLLQFEGQAGSIVQLDLTGDTDIEIYDIILLDEFGSYLDSGWTSVETLLPSDGVYWVHIEGEDSAEYTLSSSILEIPEMTFGDLIEATTATQQFYTFFGEAGDVIDIELVSSSPNFDPYLTLYDEEWNEISYNDDSGRGFNGYDSLISEQQLPRTGRYFIEAGRSGSDIEYELTLQYSEE